MNRDELLDKLAMELAEWPDFKVGEIPCPQAPGLWGTRRKEWECFATGDDNPIHFQHWLDRRTELINEPDDADAPEWARWKAQDADGEWFWYEHEPKVDADSCQWVSCGIIEHTEFYEGHIPAGHDWETTLREVKRETRRQLNPQNSSITDSQAREFAEEFKICGDGAPCGQDDYCDDCPNAPHAQDARRLDAQLANDMRQQCNDNINPSHYRQGGIECIDAIKSATVGKTGIEAACVANVIKYLWRYEEKNGVEDIEKALWYINRLHDEVHD